MELFYKVEDKPKFSQLIVLALQQLLAIMAATIAVPAIINTNEDLVAAGIFANIPLRHHFFLFNRKVK